MHGISFSLWHWLIVLFFLLPIWPAWITCKRVGLSGSLGILIVVPVIGLIMLWVFAFSKWPIDRLQISSSES
jgi:hypothetical protein